MVSLCAIVLFHWINTSPGIGPKNPEQSTATISSSEHNAGNPVFPTMFLSPTYATPPAARTARPEALIIFSKESGGSDGTGEPETAQSRDEGHIVDADSPQVPQAASSTEPNESENVALPTDNSQNHDIETPHEDSQPPYTVDEATPEGRREHVKKYLEENNIPTRFTMINLLDKMATQRVTDNVRNTSTGLPSKGTSDLDGLDGPRIEEICKDETQDLPAPTAPLKERAQRMLPSRDTSPDPPAEDPSKAMTVTPRLDEPDLEANTSDRNERVAASFPSTRRTSPERGRFRSVSPAKGLGLSEIRQPSDNRENISPSRPPPNKTLSYKQVAITSSTPPIQPGEIVELVPHDNGQSGKEGQGVKVIRSMGSKDPWRVPSSEQPWGANNKSRANSSAKASEPLP